MCRESRGGAAFTGRLIMGPGAPPATLIEPTAVSWQQRSARLRFPAPDLCLG